VERGIEHILVIDEAHAGRADRHNEGRAGQGERRGGCDHGDDVGIVLHVVRKYGDSDLGIAAPAFGEQRPDRAVNQPGGQSVLFSRAALALKVATRNTASRVIFFGVVDSEREEIDSFLRLLGCHHGGEHGGLAVGGEHGAVGLARYTACLKGYFASTPIEFNAMHIEHCVFLSWFPASPESHEQDGEKLSRATAMRGANASGDPAMAFRTWLCARATLSPLPKPPAAPIAAGLIERSRPRAALRNAPGESAPRGTNHRRMPSFSIKFL